LWIKLLTNASHLLKPTILGLAGFGDPRGEALDVQLMTSSVVDKSVDEVPGWAKECLLILRSPGRNTKGGDRAHVRGAKHSREPSPESLKR
jgi:hypothetical protein